ncbi:MAG: methyltransferase domain-containing protein [Alphaproteobacteria bacterium]|nr:methyltransferase domain-containing protein [Alphaproteobacteria bacterium]
MPQNLTYETLEKLRVAPPVDRLDYISSLCRDKVVLDIGCFDETALVKRDTLYWLHGRIGSVARDVVGIDSSDLIPADGLVTGANSAIYRGDGVNPDEACLGERAITTIVAGEFIEHVESPLLFFKNMKERFPGRTLVISTPNGVSVANTLLGMIGREVQHRDHIHVFSFKTLNTMCIRSGFADWEIIPYKFYATEMILQSTGTKRLVVRGVQWAIRVVERLFPLLSFGYVVRITI